jgi:hypothetical protein
VEVGEVVVERPVVLEAADLGELDCIVEDDLGTGVGEGPPESRVKQGGGCGVRGKALGRSVDRRGESACALFGRSWRSHKVIHRRREGHEAKARGQARTDQRAEQPR